MADKVTQQELKERLGWSFEQKRDHALLVIESFLAQYPNAVVSFSGGMDSLVMLDLVRKIDPGRKAVFVNTTNELSEIVRFVKTIENVETILPEITFIEIIEKYGFPLISKNVSRMLNDLKHPTEFNRLSRERWLTGKTPTGKKSVFVLPEKYKHLVNTPFDVTNKCCYFLKKKPFKKLTKEGALIGTMASDSRDRSFAYMRTGCINHTKKHALPLSVWTKKDIWEYIQKEKLKYCSIYDQGESHTGCAYCGFGTQFDTARFARLKEREPKRYERIMNVKNNGVTYADAIKIAMNIPIEGYQQGLFLDLH